jgi:siroheme synthase
MAWRRRGLASSADTIVVLMGTTSLQHIVIGEVVRFRDRIRWFDQDPQAQSPTILPGSAREGQPT